jgi:hypothetical protein
MRYLAAAVLIVAGLCGPAAADHGTQHGIVHLTVPYDIAGLPPTTTRVQVECFLAAEATAEDPESGYPRHWQFERLATRPFARSGGFTLVFRLPPYRTVPRPTRFRCDLQVTALDQGVSRVFNPYMGARLLSGNAVSGREIVPAVKRFVRNTVRVEGALTAQAFVVDEPPTADACPCGCGADAATSACAGDATAPAAGKKNLGPINPDGSSAAPAPPRIAMPYVAPGQTVPRIVFRGAAAIAPAVR